MKKIFMIVSMIICLSSCSVLNETRIENINDQQFVTRNIIDNCETFDCEKNIEIERELLIKYIAENKSPIILGCQQSILTSITKKCMELNSDNIDNNECVECKGFEKENIFLKQYFNNLNK